MTLDTLLEELRAAITTLTNERDQVINEHARVDQLNKFLKEEVRILSGKLERETLEGNRLREEVRRSTIPRRADASDEVWDDVTRECIVTAGAPHAMINRMIYHYRAPDQYIDVMHYCHLHEYRIRQTNDWRNGMTALIIERKRS